MAKRKILALFKSLDIQNVRLSFNVNKLSSMFSLKQKTPNLLLSMVNYKFTCAGDPAQFYIGETTRQLIVRIEEHAKPNKNSAIFDHLKQCNSCHVNFLHNQFEVLSRSSSQFDNMIKEAISIKHLNPPLNKQKHQGCSYLLKLF